jgi:hypothetical protein
MSKSPSPPAALSHEQADADLRLGDDAAGAALRLRALELADGSDWSRYEDHEVLAAVQRSAAAAPAAAPPMFRLVLASPAAPPAPAAAAAPTAPRAAAPAAPTQPDVAADTAFSVDIDVAAMVQALHAAARDGVPFCEECERARQAAAAAA